MPVVDRFEVFEDTRGTLVPVEFDDVPFPVRRVFVVHGSTSRHARGDHGVPCDELVVLLSGRARFDVVGHGGEHVETLLGRRGDALLLRPDERVVYELDGPGSSILVLASEPYVAP